MSDKTDVSRLVSPLKNSEFGAAEFRRQIWQAFPKPGVSLDDCLEQSYWRHVATQVKSGDRIELLAEDMSWYAEVIVIASGRLWAKVQTITYVELDANALAAQDDATYQVQWGGPAVRWRVLDGNEVVKDNFQTKEDAQRWAQAHDQAVNS